MSLHRISTLATGERCFPLPPASAGRCQQRDLSQKPLAPHGPPGRGEDGGPRNAASAIRDAGLRLRREAAKTTASPDVAAPCWANHGACNLDILGSRQCSDAGLSLADQQALRGAPDRPAQVV